MNLNQKRVVRVRHHFVEKGENFFKFSFHFDVSEVVFGEISYLTGTGEEALITRTLIEHGWLSSTLEELVEHNTSIVFSRDRRSVEVVCERRLPVHQERLLEMMEKLRLAETERKYEEAEPC